MNDNELDRLLDTWEAPAPSESMRQRLRARFPRTQRIRFARPLRWGLATLFASAALTLAIAQTGESHWGATIWGGFMAFHQGVSMFFEAHRALFMRQAIEQSQPKVYVDGQPAGPLEYGHAASLKVRVPGDGVYLVMLYRYMERSDANGHPTGWVAAGTIHGNLVEFEADGKQVRIECNRTIVDGERPVFVMRQSE